MNHTTQAAELTDEQREHMAFSHTNIEEGALERYWYRKGLTDMRAALEAKAVPAGAKEERVSLMPRGDQCPYEFSEDVRAAVLGANAPQPQAAQPVAPTSLAKPRCNAPGCNCANVDAAGDGCVWDGEGMAASVRPLLKTMSRVLKHYVAHANLLAHEALQYQKRIRNLERELVKARNCWVKVGWLYDWTASPPDKYEEDFTSFTTDESEARNRASNRNVRAVFIPKDQK